MIPANYTDFEKIQHAINSLCDYFCINPDEAIAQTTSILENLRIVFGGDGTSRFSIGLFWSKWDSTQLTNINKALAELGAITATIDIDKGYAALQVVLNLLKKSRSQNWSAGITVPATFFSEAKTINASLNNSLVCALLKQAGLTGSYAEMLGSYAKNHDENNDLEISRYVNGVAFCDVLQRRLMQFNNDGSILTTSRFRASTDDLQSNSASPDRNGVINSAHSSPMRLENSTPADEQSYRYSFG